MLPVVVVVLAVVLAGATLLPAASYSTGDAGRGATVGVTEDSQAMLALDTSAGVRIGNTDRLVVVTNDLPSTATVTVTLSDDAATMADLVVDGVVVGDEYSLELDSTASVSIDVQIPDDESYVGEQIVFDTSADSVDIDAVAANRSAPIEDNT